MPAKLLCGCDSMYKHKRDLFKCSLLSAHGPLLYASTICLRTSVCHTMAKAAFSISLIVSILSILSLAKEIRKGRIQAFCLFSVKEQSVLSES